MAARPASAGTGSVMGIGKSVPSARRIYETTPRKSASPMNCLSGEKAPVASISRSHTARGEIWSEGRVLAYARASARSSLGTSRSTSSPPYGEISVARDVVAGKDEPPPEWDFVSAPVSQRQYTPGTGHKRAWSSPQILLLY